MILQRLWVDVKILPMVERTSGTATGLRERKKSQRRAAIEAVALKLFDARGFDATTIGDIAAAVSISPRTFFYYFETKEDLVLADYSRRLDRIIDEFNQRPGDEDPWSSLKESFLVVAGDYESEREQLISRFTIMASSPSVFARSLQLQAGWEDALAVALADRIGQRWKGPAGLIAPRLLAAAALASMRSSLRLWLEGGTAEALPPMVEACFDQLSAGFGEGAPGA